MVENEFKVIVTFKPSAVYKPVEIMTFGSYIPVPTAGSLQIRGADGKSYAFNWDEVLFVTVEKK